MSFAQISYIEGHRYHTACAEEITGQEQEIYSHQRGETLLEYNSSTQAQDMKPTPGPGPLHPVNTSFAFRVFADSSCS